ncbi:hypothetical protein OAU50_00370 [Planctomycetota bacterium]|nr:hypothetical protein [Planctomycetota bacterium]
MAKKQTTTVASWYWVVTTALVPAFVITALVWVHFQQQRSDYRTQASNIELKVVKNQQQLVPLQNQMTNVATALGFGMGDVKAYVDDFKDTVRSPDGVPQEDAKPEAERNPVYVMMRRTEADYYEGKVQEYMSARKWLDNLDLKVRRYVAYKSQEYYTLKTIELGTPESESLGKLSRSVQQHEERDALVVPADKLENVNLNLNPDTDIKEGFMKPPARVTLEMILGKQFELITQLQQANNHQYSLLFAETTGKSNDQFVGFDAGEEAKRKTNDVKDRLMSGPDPLLDELNSKSESELNEAKSAAEEAMDAAGAAKSDYELRGVANDQRLTGLADGFQNEITAAKSDAEAFKKMTVNIPLIKTIVKLEKSEADGEISFSDFTRKLCHIDLGRSNNVKAGQRFEVWRTHGRERDKFIGVIEIIRTLSNSYSLCTVLSLVNDDDPVRQSDTIVSRLYHKGKFLKVALHGDFKPPTEAYGKARLAELLRLAGCKVVDKVQPGVDLTVVGSNLRGDEWYRDARKKLRFESMKEDDIRLYIDPR